MKKILLLILVPLIIMGCVKKEMLFEIKGQINGIVVDENNLPVTGAKVSLGSKNSITDEKGYFLISDLDVGGKPKYQVYIEKEGYSSQVQEVVFNTTIDTNGTSTSNTQVPLNNSVVSIKVTLGGLNDLKGKLILPQGISLNPTDTLKIEAKITINPSYTQSVKLEEIQGTINSDLTFTLKNISKYGTFTSGSSTEKIVSNLKISLFINNESVASYIASLQNPDFTKMTSEKINGVNTINLGNLDLSKLYKITGKVYKNISEVSKDGIKIPNALVALLKSDGTEIKRVVSDINGNYEFTEVEAGSNYQLKLLNSDSDKDGNIDYWEKSNFEKFSIISGQLGNKAINLWFDDAGSYSISGTLYAGNKEDVPVANAVVALFSSNGLIDEVKTDSNGLFQFTKVTAKDVYMIAYDYDSDNNGYINFIGYKNSDASTLKTKVSLNNTNLSNVSGVELYAKVNSDEPNYILKLKGGNFFLVNSAGTVYNQTTLASGDNIILNFDKELSQSTLDSIGALKTKLVSITDISSGATIETLVTLDGSDKKKLIVAPKSILSAGTYRIQLSTELNTATAYNYGVKNSINTQVLNSMTLTIEN